MPIDAMPCRAMMRIFFGGRYHGEVKAIGGVVEGRCEEFTGVCKESIVGASNGKEAQAVARGSGAESDEIGDPVSINSEGGIVRLSVLGPAVTDSELAALFDAHDALVAACVGGQVPFVEFVAAYGGFPSYALDMAEASPNAAAALRRFRGRIEFHRQVSGVLAGVGGGQGAMGLPDGADTFLGVAAFQRLRQMMVRYPGFKLEPGVGGE